MQSSVRRAAEREMLVRSAPERAPDDPTPESERLLPALRLGPCGSHATPWCEGYAARCFGGACTLSDDPQRWRPAAARFEPSYAA